MLSGFILTILCTKSFGPFWALMDMMLTRTAARLFSVLKEVVLVAIRWWLLMILLVLFAAGALVAGFLAQGLSTFVESLLAGIAPSALVLAVVIWLIEGPNMTSESRRRSVTNQAAYSALHRIGEMSWGFGLEIAEYLESSLAAGIELNGEERGDATKFRPLLFQVFEVAVELPETCVLPYEDGLPEEVYRQFVLDGCRWLVSDTRDRVRGDYDVQAALLEVLEALEELNHLVTRAMWPSNLRDEKMRYRMLGKLGRQLLELDEPIRRVLSRVS